MTTFKTVDGIIVMPTIVQGVSTFRTVNSHLSRDDNNNVLGKCFVSKMDISIFYSSNKRITTFSKSDIFYYGTGPVIPHFELYSSLLNVDTWTKIIESYIT